MGACGVVGQAVILPPLEGELGLQEQIVPGHQAARDRAAMARPTAASW